VGVKQGFTLSPELFSFFFNNLDSFIESNGAPYVSLDWFRLSCMLFVDDIALVVDNRNNLQKQLDIINKIKKKDLELNTTKSIVLLFRSQGDVDSKVDFNFGGTMSKIKEELVHLGIKFSA